MGYPLSLQIVIFCSQKLRARLDFGHSWSSDGVEPPLLLAGEGVEEVVGTNDALHILLNPHFIEVIFHTAFQFVGAMFLGR